MYHTITTSYACKFTCDNVKALRNTVAYFTDMCKYLKVPVLAAWNEISDLNAKDAMRRIETMIHATKGNPNPEYKDFDSKFYKCPTYLRRAAINHVIGAIRSYKSNLDKWNHTDKSTKKPSEPMFKREFPVLYKGNMFIRTDDYTAKIKVFYKNDWVWTSIRFRKSDADYIMHHCVDRTETAPSLVYSHKKWHLTFAYTEAYPKLRTVSLQERKILAVDLGINNAAVCCVMNCDGTILARDFLKLTRETDHLQFVLNRIKRAQKHGTRHMPALWTKAKGINHDIASKTACFIMQNAIVHGVYVIVFEHLDFNKKNVKQCRKKRKTKLQLLALWKAQTVQDTVTLRAHRAGIRISHVNACNTSALAFDGSGKVTRGIYQHNGKVRYNYSICVFPNGKTYHCDLNASYNIGSRYFIRESIKPLSETAKSCILAKVPECKVRSTCTLSSLINLNAVLHAPVACCG